MPQKPFTQAEMATWIETQKREGIERALGEAQSILVWAELPETKRVRNLMKKLEEPYIKILKKNQWKDEAQGRGLCYLWNYLGFLEELIEASRERVQNIRLKKEKGV